MLRVISLIPLFALSWAATLPEPKLNSEGQLARSLQKARGIEPLFPTDPGAPEDCTYWFDNEGGVTCQALVTSFATSMEELLSWVSRIIHLRVLTLHGSIPSNTG